MLHIQLNFANTDAVTCEKKPTMYSQNDEEKYILEAVGDAPGVFLDIGAWDGKTFSNTAALVDRGWSGVLVEPSPSSFNTLLARYGSNPKLQLVHAAVGADSGLVKWWDSGGDGVSTSSPAHYATWRETATYFPPYYLAQICLFNLWDTFPDVREADVISIDTEGTSGELFKMALSLGFHPKVWIVEYDLKDVELIECNRHYECVYKSSENIVLIHESIRDRVSR